MVSSRPILGPGTGPCIIVIQRKLLNNYHSEAESYLDLATQVTARVTGAGVVSV